MLQVVESGPERQGGGGAQKKAQVGYMLEKWIEAWGQMRRFEMIRIQMRKVVVQKETDEMMMNVKRLRSMRRRCRKRSSCETGNCVRVLKFLKKPLVQRRMKTKRRWAFRALELEPKENFFVEGNVVL